MKAGIVTQFGYDNMGNKLQNYALQQELLKYTNEVKTIRNIGKTESIGSFLRQLPCVRESVLLNKLFGRYRKLAILAFHKNFIDTNRRTYFFNVDDVCLEAEDVCDIYCVGSDQVWKPNYGRSAMFNYLGFAPHDATFSYAASFGIDKIPEEYVEAVRKGLNHIKFISVREDAGKRIVEELTGRTDVQVLVDPTMLLTTAEWDEIIAPPKAKLPEKYVLTYFLGTVSHSRRDAIYSKAAQMGCQVIEVMDKNSPFYVIGPSEFVYLIKHAALVCTDSFHGSVFSFLYRRPMAIFDRKGSEENMSSRLETLAEKFDLRDCLIREDNLSDICLTPDYSAGYAALQQERQKSKAFLDMVFQEAERAGLCR